MPYLSPTLQLVRALHRDAMERSDQIGEVNGSVEVQRWLEELRARPEPVSPPVESVGGEPAPPDGSDADLANLANEARSDHEVDLELLGDSPVELVFGPDPTPVVLEPESRPFVDVHPPPTPEGVQSADAWICPICSKPAQRRRRFRKGEICLECFELLR